MEVVCGTGKQRSKYRMDLPPAGMVGRCTQLGLPLAKREHARDGARRGDPPGCMP